MVLQSLTEALYEPLRQASLRDVSLKTNFLLTLASAKMISKLHGISFQVRHSSGRDGITFSFMPIFMAKN